MPVGLINCSNHCAWYQLLYKHTVHIPGLSCRSPIHQIHTIVEVGESISIQISQKAHSNTLGFGSRVFSQKLKRLFLSQHCLAIGQAFPGRVRNGNDWVFFEQHLRAQLHMRVCGHCLYILEICVCNNPSPVSGFLILFIFSEISKGTFWECKYLHSPHFSRNNRKPP